MSLLYHIHVVASHNKWFTRCGKLTSLTSLVYKYLHVPFVPELLYMGGSSGDVREAKEGLENEL